MALLPNTDLLYLSKLRLFPETSWTRTFTMQKAVESLEAVNPTSSPWFQNHNLADKKNKLLDNYPIRSCCTLNLNLSNHVLTYTAVLQQFSSFVCFKDCAGTFNRTLYLYLFLKCTISPKEPSTAGLEAMRDDYLIISKFCIK